MSEAAQASALRIVRRNWMRVAWDPLRSFQLDVRDAVPVATLGGDARLSLYCIDSAADRLLFVQGPDTAALTHAAFMGEVQFRSAQAVYAVASAHAPAMAAPLRRPVLVLSISRCGSTLVSRMLAEFPGVRSYSEPLAHTQIAMLALARARDGADLARLARLATACLQPIDPGGDRLALKFMSEVNPLAGALADALPDADFLFLHRAPRSWARSVIRAFRASTEELVWQWCQGAAALGELRSRGRRVLCLDYDELARDGIASARRIAAFCGLDPPPDGAVARVLARDSQAGTHVALARLIPAFNVEARIERFLAQIGGMARAFRA